jgi:uncharacterized protein YbgA (DUF1722 family)/uncharacterized protein YbbK (DUF523 family)
MVDKIKIGVSSCLLGNKVRYDGGRQQDRLITDTLGQFFEFVPVCPEVECGLSVPREAMRLVGDPRNPRLVTRQTAIDLTEKMQTWTERRLPELETEKLLGFIFKSKSPSSGMERVTVYAQDGTARKSGVGMFARAFMDHFPLLPVEEDGRLHDIRWRENFIQRIFSYNRWRKVRQEKRTPSALIDFHTTHKLFILSHSEKHYRALGRLVAHAHEKTIDDLFDEYEKMLLSALQLCATIKKNINVLQHMLGYFKKRISSDEKQELLEAIEQYRSAYIPLVVPVTLMNHYVRKYEVKYLAGQCYLQPHPIELMLRNHA